MRHHQLIPIHDLQSVTAIAVLVVAPVAFWYLKRRIDRWEDDTRRESARRCAVDVAVTLAKSIQLCEDVRLALLQAAGRVPDETIEAAIASLDLSRQTLRSYLRRHIPLHELIPLASVAEQRLGQGAEAMIALQARHTPGPEYDRAYPGKLAAARTELALVVERLRRLQPDLGRAIAKVDAGWALTD
jgi:hypothetical protein